MGDLHNPIPDMLRYLDTSAKQRNKELLYMFNEVFRMSEADLFGLLIISAVFTQL